MIDYPSPELNLISGPVSIAAVALAISHEWFSLSLHPGMSLAGKNREK